MRQRQAGCDPWIGAAGGGGGVGSVGVRDGGGCGEVSEGLSRPVASAGRALRMRTSSKAGEWPIWVGRSLLSRGWRAVWTRGPHRVQVREIEASAVSWLSRPEPSQT